MRRGSLVLLLPLLLFLSGGAVRTVLSDSFGHELAEEDDGRSTSGNNDVTLTATSAPSSEETDSLQELETRKENGSTTAANTTTATTMEGLVRMVKLPWYQTLPWWLQHGRLEYGCLVGLLLVTLMAFNGKLRNERVVESWVRTTAEAFRQKFESCGFSESDVKPFGWNYFEFYASGRSNCSYCLVKLQCRPRQCLWQDTILSWLMCNEDVMDLEMSLTMPEKFSLVIGRRMQLKMLHSSNKNLESCISLKSSPLLSRALCVLSDESEVVEKLITENEASVLNAYAQSMRHLVVSDLVPSQRFASHNKILRLSVAIPSKDQMSEILGILNFAFGLIDKIGSLTLSEKARHRVKKARETLEKRQLQESEEEKREALEKKKAEKLEGSNPEEKRKRLEKQLKKREKALKPKVKMMRM